LGDDEPRGEINFGMNFSARKAFVKKEKPIPKALSANRIGFVTTTFTEIRLRRFPLISQGRWQPG
jgi:hypothetical protein